MRHAIGFLLLAATGWSSAAPIGACDPPEARAQPGDATAKTQDDAEPQPTLDAETIELNGGTLYLDRVYADQREGLVAQVQGLFDAAHTAAERLTPEQVEAESQKLVDAAIQTTGLTVDEAARGELLSAGKMFLGMLNQRLDPIEGPITLYLLSVPTTRAYTRTGGELPDISYDPDTDKIKLDLSIRTGSYRDEDRAEQSAFTLMSNFGEDPSELVALLKSFFTHGMSLLSGRVPGLDPDDALEDAHIALILHELIEIALFRELNPHNEPDFRWFSDGFANALAEVAVVEAGYPETTAFFSTYHDERYQAPDPSINLRFWHAAHYSIKLGEGYPAFRRLVLDRYAYAYAECKRLTDAVGLEGVRAMMRGLQARRDERGTGLADEIEALTGYDIDARLALYQAHADPADLDAHHLRRYIATTNAEEPTEEDFERGTIELYLLLEQRTKTGGEVGLIAKRLIDRFVAAGDPASAEQVYLALENLILGPPQQQAASRQTLSWMYYRCRFALEHGRLEAARDLAAAWLDDYTWGETDLEVMARCALLTIAADEAQAAGDAETAVSRSGQARALLPRVRRTTEGDELGTLIARRLDEIEQAIQPPHE